MSLEYVEREFKHVKYDGELAGWSTDGLIARPLTTRICECHVTQDELLYYKLKYKASQDISNNTGFFRDGYEIHHFKKLEQ